MTNANTGGFFDETFDAEQLPDPLPPDPFPMIKSWFDQSWKSTSVPNSNAMGLATVDGRGQPSSRMVLCKGIMLAEGAIVFYTNYNSRKGRELATNPRCCLLFHWDELGRQIRVEGTAVKSPPEESDAYFATRPWESRLGAWASDQSEPIASREALLEKVATRAMELDLDLSDIVDGHAEGLVIPRPPHWGGYRVWAEAVELWCNGTGRVHERARWTRSIAARGDSFETGPWSVTRLQP